MDDQHKLASAGSSTKNVQRVCILDIIDNYKHDVTHNHTVVSNTSDMTSKSYIMEECSSKGYNDVERYQHDAHDVLKALDPSISVEICYLRPNIRQSIAMIRRKQSYTDLFINLCDYQDAIGQKLVEYMENHGLAFTGAHSAFYDPTRIDLKTVCAFYDIHTPPFSFVYDLTTIERIPSELGGFPLFVKPEHGYGSIGINETSVVHNMDELKQRVENVLEEFGGVLVEQFMDGREFSVLVAGSRYTKTETFPPIEYQFERNRQLGNKNSTAPKIITNKDKWGGGPMETELWNLVDEKENELKQELMSIATKLYEAFEGEGLARFDIRQEDKTETLYVLDINPNPALFYKDNDCTTDIIVHLTGWSKHQFMQFLIDDALKRQKRYRSMHGYFIKRTVSKGLGLYAAYDLKKDDVIYSDEEQPVRLVTRQFVRENWSEKERHLFDMYAWPLNSGIYVLWSLDSSKWKSVNHSCDPNMIMNGLQYIARRDIVYGEELTMDYATIDPSHSISQCWCGTDLCRKTIQPNEYREEWFEKRYGTYVNPYIRMLIEMDETTKTIKGPIDECK